MSFNFNSILTLIILCFVSCMNTSCNSPSYVNLKERNELFENYDNRFVGLLAEANGQVRKDILTYESIGPGLLPKKVAIKGNHYELGYLIGLIAKGYFGDAMKKEICVSG